MDNTQVATVTDQQDLFFKQLQGSDLDIPLSGNNGIAYFLAIFMAAFQDGTNKLQSGETNLTESMEKITKNINDSKTAQLKADNTAINKLIDTGKTDQKTQNSITEAENTYKVDDASYQSQLQALSPITTSDSDLTTSISQNNSMINQMAMSVIGIVKMVAENLIRAS